MKLQNKRRYPYVFIGGCVIAFVVWYSLVADHKPEVLISMIGAVGGLTYFFYSQHLNETKLLKELTLEFNQRYASLNADLNKVLFGTREGLLSETEREVVFRYFNLCAEEYFFYTTGYVDEEVWKAWYNGMRVFFEHPKIHALWDQDCTAESYYQFRPPA